MSGAPTTEVLAVLVWECYDMNCSTSQCGRTGIETVYSLCSDYFKHNANIDAVVSKEPLGKGRENGSGFKSNCALPFSSTIMTNGVFLKRSSTSFISTVSACRHIDYLRLSA